MIARTKYFTNQAWRFIASETRGLHQAAYVLAAFSFGSQLLALVRDRLLAALFGAGHTLDLYYAAFRVPDFLFATIASLFSLYALLPVLTQLEEEKRGLMIAFLRDILWVFFVALAFVSMIAYILAPYLARLVAPGFAHDPGSYYSLVLLLRILLLQPILLGASNTIAALTQLRHRFVLYSISPLLYNLGIIFGAVALYPRFGVAGLGWGVVLGALLHLLAQVPFFLTEQPGEKLPLARMIKSVLEVLTLSVPRTLALASTQITLLVLVSLGSLLSSGSVAVFNFAYNLQGVPLAIIGVSYSVAAFPTLARLHAQGMRERFVGYIETALRHIVFWSIPGTVFVIVMRAQIVRLILGSGQFDWNATRLTAAALALFIISLAAQAVTLLIARVYYAVGNTRKPFYFGLADIGISIVSALLLVRVFRSSFFARAFVESLLRVADVPGTTVLMLSLGYALGSIAEFAAGYWYFTRDFRLSRAPLRHLAFESFAGAIIGASVTYAVLAATGAAGTVNTTLGLLAQSLVAGGAGLAVAVFVLWILKNRELFEAVAVVRRKFRDAPQVALEPSDVS